MYGELIPIGGGDLIPLHKTELLIGRHEDCDIVLRFSNVSSRHCKLVLSNGYWFILDQRSTNGVKVNGARVTDRRIDPGQTVHISKHGYRLQYDPQQNGATGPPQGLVLEDGELMSRSLMEKVGLQRATSVIKDATSTIADLPIIETMQKPVFKTAPTDRDFFDELNFD